GAPRREHGRRPGMRSAGLFAVLVLGGATAACARREPAYPGAVLPLAERLSGARLAVEAPLALEGLVEEVEWVRDGLASVVVRLEGEDAVGGAHQQRALWRWQLPLAPAT